MNIGAITEKPTWYSLNKQRAIARSKAYYEANKEKVKAQSKEYQSKNREKIRERERAYNNCNKEHRNAVKKKWRLANPDKIRSYSLNRKSRENRKVKYDPVASRKTGIKYKYNLTWPQFTALYEKQHGICPICAKPLKIEFGLKKGELGWNIDHCHKTNKVRGILCRSCNRGLARFGDSKEIMIKAISYLENPPYKGNE